MRILVSFYFTYIFGISLLTGQDVKNIDKSFSALKKYIDRQSTCFPGLTLDDESIYTRNWLSIENPAVIKSLRKIFESEYFFAKDDYSGNKYFYLGKMIYCHPKKFDSYIFIKVTYNFDSDESFIPYQVAKYVYLINIDKKSDIVLSNMMVMFDDYAIFPDMVQTTWSKMSNWLNYIEIEYNQPNYSNLGDEFTYEKAIYILNADGHIYAKEK
ncbi:MAG: hypothetical protein IPG79_03270 [Saprospiraceae bacterium]|nr:hypothetical protein [Saprospiraceae bacterium]MBK7523319.1 hypothetical protein [Saprospiraceae bacterium]MBK8079412.1 hypothetical protein [Saprospiraceae bacterium]MBK8371689.1 hypothetical protein [Saprospiraceae bacterium]MBK8853462.1 hypothetical protein [Saprospiraceae bacterium]